MILSLITGSFTKLPSFVRILITSRPEKDIMGSFRLKPSAITRHLLDIDSQSTSEDIGTFITLQMELSRFERSELNLPADWPGEQVMDILISPRQVCSFGLPQPVPSSG
jgi:hypothetical protein